MATAVTESIVAATAEHGLPRRALLADGVVSGAAGIALALVSFFDEEFDVFALLAVPFALIALPVLLMLALGAARFIRERSTPWWGSPVILVGAAVPALGIYGSFEPFPTGTELAGLVLAIAILVAVALWFAYLRLRSPEALDRAAAHALTPEAHDVPGGRAAAERP